MAKKVLVEIIGAGTMGEAIIRRLVAAQAPVRLGVIEGNARKAKQIAGRYSVLMDNNFSLLPQAAFVVLAVKPQDLADLAKQIADQIAAGSIIISIAAGVPIGKLQKMFCCKKVVRVMPNLGLAVGQGIAAWKAAGLIREEKSAVAQFLNALGDNFEVRTEDRLNAVTAISGSGPAYFFVVAMYLEASARTMGFSARQARLLVEKTLSGSAALQIGRSYHELVSQVASRGGTTEAALEVLLSNDLPGLMLKAVRAARRRAKELSHG